MGEVRKGFDQEEKEIVRVSGLTDIVGDTEGPYLWQNHFWTVPFTVLFSPCLDVVEI